VPQAYAERALGRFAAALVQFASTAEATVNTLGSLGDLALITLRVAGIEDFNRVGGRLAAV
jgi:hypothetical protein